jgi:SlyX protein
MSEVAALTARIEALEIRLAHQDRIIEDLNKVSTDQWTQIDMLRREIDRLRDRVQEVESNRPDQPEPPPPHY